MKFFVHSKYGTGSGIAFRLWQEGHEVFMYIEQEIFRNYMDGILEKVPSINQGLARNPDVVIFDLSGSGKKADALKSEGYHVIGAGEFNDLIEMDRSFGMDMCKRIGIAVPPYRVFKKTQLDEAIAFVQETDARYVLKPDNNQSLDLTYVAKEAEDMVQELQWLKEKNVLKGDFLLQEFVKGTEISTEVWFQQGRPVGPSNGTMEVKKQMAGDLGPATGCEVSLVWPYRDLHTKVVDATIAKLFPIIERMGYTGPLDVNSIISEKDGKPYFLEFTPRFGYSAFFALAEILDTDLGEFFFHLSRGKLKQIPLLNQYASALTISIPPYPLDADKPHNRKAFELVAGKKLINIPEKNFWPHAVMQGEEGIVTAGGDGLVCYLTARGDTVEEAMNNVYELAEDLELADKQYRIDGKDRPMKDLPALAELGYETPEGVEDAVRSESV